MLVIFCGLLIVGIVGGQVYDLSHWRELLAFISSVCLAYIMIEVGLEFSAEKKPIKAYGWDAIVASSAAILPAFFWFLYFLFVLQTPWKPALLSGLSCAPTSAGVLFSMLMAAGLATTWVFSRARTLAVLDDLVTILLLTPLQVIIVGVKFESLAALVFIAIFLFASFRWQDTLYLPTSKVWLAFYGLVLSSCLLLIKNTTHIHLEVLIPAFMLGCLLRYDRSHHHDEKPLLVFMDAAIKGGFMLLVGLSFPQVRISDFPLSTTIGHVLILTILANLGKCFPFLCYRKEASWKERLGLSIAMFPRGEVGAAVLLIGLSYGFGGYVNSLALLCLAVNLILTGGFVWIILRLLPKS